MFEGQQNSSRRNQQGIEIEQSDDDQMDEQIDQRQQANSHLDDTKFMISQDTFQIYKTMVKDLQFIQLLGNPKYVLQLVNQGYFHNNDFCSYIKELRKRFCTISEQMRLIKYPQGLLNLEIMTRPGFAESMKQIPNQDRFILMCLQRNQQIRKAQT